MKVSSPRRYIALFVAAVFLPALLLSVFTLRVVRQERELFEKRAVDARRRAAMDIGAALLGWLEDLKRRAGSELATDPDVFRRRGWLSPAVIFMGKWKDGRLAFPWEPDSKASSGRTNIESGEFGRILRQGEEKEFRDQNPILAAELYRQAVAQSQNAEQKFAAMFHLARVLSKSGRGAEAVKLYESVVETASETADEYGIPLRLFAAERSAAVGGDSGRILAALENLTGGGKWLPSAALFLAKEVVGILQKRGLDAAASDRASAILDRIEGDLAVIEQSARMKAPVETRALDSEKAGLDESDESRWKAFGDTPWLINSIKTGSPSGSYLLVVDGPALLDETIREKRLETAFPGPAGLVPETGEGEPLGQDFSGVRLQFANASATAWLGSAPPGPLIYWLALALVIGATAFSMAMLLRDVRRESRLAALRSQFVSSVSHELKTPLTSIRMFAESLLLDWVSDSGQRNEYLQTIVGESERLSRLINNVLDFSRIEQGTRTYRMEPVSLPAVVRRAVRTMEFPLRQQGFEPRLDIDDGIPDIVADADALEQAVLNLLHNAMKYSGDRREISLRLYRSGDMAAIEVEDKGLGIKPEDQARIFEKYFRADSPENVRIPGAGLGLTIVRHIAEAHGGRIELESRPGEGSRFTLHIPLRTSP